MTYVYVSPVIVASVTANIDGIGAALARSNAAAAGPTTAVTAAAADEVSAAIASLFSRHGAQYQALAGRVAAFHDQFTRNLAAGAAAYAGAEAANVGQLVSWTLQSPAAAVN